MHRVHRSISMILTLSAVNFKLMAGKFSYCIMNLIKGIYRSTTNRSRNYFMRIIHFVKRILCISDGLLTNISLLFQVEINPERSNVVCNFNQLNNLNLGLPDVTSQGKLVI